jgi:hypothetical protein
MGRWREVDLGDGNVHSGPPTVDFAQWIQADFGYEIRTRHGFSLRAAPGAAWMVNSDDIRCDQGGTAVRCAALSRGDRAPVVIGTFTISIGYAFGV